MIVAREVHSHRPLFVLTHRQLPTYCQFCRDQLVRRRIRSRKTGLYTHYFQHRHNPNCIGVNQPRLLGFRTTIL